MAAVQEAPEAKARMRFIAAVALLAACQAAYGQSPAPAKVAQVSAFNNFFGSVVGVQNALLAPLAPFGRKLSQHGQAQADATFVDTVGNTKTNPLLRSQVVKGNAIGSLFYGVGFSTPGVLAQAFTGNDGTTTAGRRLLQDPYHLTSKANVVASLLRGYNPNLSPLFQQPTFSPPLNQQFTIPPQPTVQAGTSAKIGLGRRLLQDNLAANYLGSAVVNNVNVLDLLLGSKEAQVNGVVPHQGRKLSQIIPGRTGVYQTGSSTIQNNAVGSIIGKSASLMDPINDRKAVLGFQQDRTRHLLDLATKTNADASLLSGNVGPGTVRQSIFGYNQNNN